MTGTAPDSEMERPVLADSQSPPRGTRIGRTLQMAAGLVLGALALLFAGRTIEWPALAAALGEARLPWIGLTLILSLLTPVLKAMRWRWLFYPEGIDLGTGRLAGLVVIGQAVNFMVPGRFGDLVRTYLAGEEGHRDKWFVLGTVAAEKLIDLVVLALLVIALLPFVVLPAGLAARVELVVLTALAVMAGTAMLLGGRTYWLRLARRILAVLPARAAARWEDRITASLDGLAALQNRRAAAAIWGYTLAFWAVATLTNLSLLAAFGLTSPWMALVVLAVLQGGVAVPSTPGKIGVFQLLCMAALAVFGVPEPVGLAYGLVLHVLVVGGVSVWAALALWRRSWNLRRLAAVSTSWQ